MQNQSIYLRFLSLLHAIEGKGELPNLDLDAKRLLEVIGVQHSHGKPLTVSDAMAMNQIASPATIHRKLDVLRDIGMIETYFEGNNRRTKYLRPTPQAASYFSKVGDVMQQAGVTRA
jgi:DNA-binding MarR family transcriptional regulator